MQAVCNIFADCPGKQHAVLRHNRYKMPVIRQIKVIYRLAVYIYLSPVCHEKTDNHIHNRSLSRAGRAHKSYTLAGINRKVKILYSDKPILKCFCDVL